MAFSILHLEDLDYLVFTEEAEAELVAGTLVTADPPSEGEFLKEIELPTTPSSGVRRYSTRA